MANNQAREAKGRVKDGVRSFTGDPVVKNERQAEEASTTVNDRGNDLVDTLPGRGSE